VVFSNEVCSTYTAMSSRTLLSDHVVLLSVYATGPAFFATAGSTARTAVSGSRVDGQRLHFSFRDVLEMTSL
jgi:hypothetical protein